MEEECESVYWRNNAYHNMTDHFFKNYTALTDYDVTLVCNDSQKLKAHINVLSAASPFLRKIFSSIPEKPIVLFLPCFEYYYLYSLLELFYKGSTKVYHKNLASFNDTAKELEINMLFENVVESQTLATALKPVSQLEAPSLLTEQNITEQTKCRTESVIKYIKSNISVLEEGEIHENSKIETGRTKYPEPISCFEPYHYTKEPKVPKENRVVKVEADNYEQNEIGKNEIDTTCANESFPENVDLVLIKEKIKNTPKKAKSKKFNIIKNQNGPTMKPTKNEQSQYKCIFCNFTADTPWSLTEHKLRSHEKEKIGVKKRMNLENFPKGKEHDINCEICGKHFKLLPNRRKNHYLAHLKRHKLRQGDCGCGIEFRKAFQKERHNKTKHMGYLACTKCKQCFLNESFLKAHEVKHNKTYDCTMCSEVFPSRWTLRIHLEDIHNQAKVEKKIQKCSLCGKMQNGVIGLKAHMKKVHKPEVCQICGKTVKILNRHIENVHVDDSKKKVKCEQCGKGFNDTSHLRFHQMSVHLKTRPYRCRYGCIDNIGYNDNSNRLSHERKRHSKAFKEVQSDKVKGKV